MLAITWFPFGNLIGIEDIIWYVMNEFKGLHMWSIAPESRIQEWNANLRLSAYLIPEMVGWLEGLAEIWLVKWGYRDKVAWAWDCYRRAMRPSYCSYSQRKVGNLLRFFFLWGCLTLTIVQANMVHCGSLCFLEVWSKSMLLEACVNYMSTFSIVTTRFPPTLLTFNKLALKWLLTRTRTNVGHEVAATSNT